MLTRNVRQKGWIILLVLLVLGLSGSKSLVHLLTEAWWFEAVGFSQVFWTRFSCQASLWLGTLIIYALVLWGNYQLAMRWTRDRGFQFVRDAEFENYTKAIVQSFAVGLIGLMALAAATTTASAWESVLQYFNATPFGSQDPIFQADLSLYLFQLPLYEGVRTWLLWLLVLAFLWAMLVYGLKGAILANFDGRVRLTGRTKLHLTGLAVAIALLVAWGFWLDRYELLYSSQGLVYGAGYVDVHAKLVAYQVLSLLAAAIAALFLISLSRSSLALPLSGIGIFLVVALLINGVYPWFVQHFVVGPNELAKEKPFIENNIRLTQAAYHLSDVAQQPFAAEAKLNQQTLRDHQATLQNIRLWDYRPLLSTYKQLQEIRLYYKFRDVDVDRYTLNGNYQQVMLAARELSMSQLPEAAQTWVNRRLKYTHGYGLVMSPVNRVSAEGLPELYVRDIPPVATVNLPLKQPALYYGEEPNSYVFTGMTTDEFDYPRGDTNALTRYSGNGGVPLPSLWRRLVYAYDLNSIQILISNYFSRESRIHYYRTVSQRIRHIAPFLQLDSDPYLVVVNGRLQWIVDAYTTSDRYPYSEPISQTPDAEAILKHENLQALLQTRVNYIRNSVKVVIDAYDGTLQFFVMDEADPVLATYRRIFPQLFLARSTIPPALKAHFRYPEDLLRIQAQMYLTYHMSDPEVFYNREDLWRLPRQIYEGSEVNVEPYYVVMRLPGEAEPSFVLILPFTPANKDNMIAWMAARSNGPDYGKLLLYEFPKQRLVYGPRQIEARIDQEPSISQQFTLWSQSGSKVIRGDLLVIPIDQSLLYVEPVYLRAEQAELPELKRVIAAYDKSVVMAETLDQALAAVFGGNPAATTSAQRTSTQSPTPLSPLAQQALDTYRKGQTALKQGDWAAYGRYQQELERILQQLNGTTSSQ